MAYNLRYYTNFYNKLGNNIEINIYGKDFTGTPETITISNVVIKSPEIERYETIFSKGCTIDIVQKKSEPFKYKDLFVTPQKHNLVEIKEAGEIIFKGYIEPELFTQELTKNTTVVKIPASDGLKTLNLYNNYPDLGGSEMIKLIDVLRACLDQTGIELNIKINSKLFEENHITTNKTLFDQTYIDIETLKDKNGDFLDAKTILSNVLMGFRISQIDNKWVIDRIKDLGLTTKSIVEYKTDGTVSSYQENNNPVSLGVYHSGGNLEFRSGLKKITVNTELNKHNSLVRYNKIINATEKASGLELTPGPNEWEYNNSFEIHRAENFVIDEEGWEGRDNQNYITVPVAYVGPDSVVFKPWSGFITHDGDNKLANMADTYNHTEKDGLSTRIAIDLKEGINDEDTLSIKLKWHVPRYALAYQIKNFSAGRRNIISLLKIKVDGGGYLFYNETAGHYALDSETDRRFLLEKFTINYPYDDWRDPYPTLEEQTKEITFNIPLRDILYDTRRPRETQEVNELILTICPLLSGDDVDGVGVDAYGNEDLDDAQSIITSVLMDAKVEISRASKPDNEISGTINDDFTNKKEVNLLYSDIQNYEYKNAFHYFDSADNRYYRTANWSDDGINYYPFAEQFIKDAFQIYSSGRHYINADKKFSNPIKSNSIFIENNISGNIYFYLSGFDYNIREGVYRLYLNEFKDDENIILE